VSWPTRRTPAFALTGSLVGIILGLILSQRQTKAAERIGSELGTLVGTRWNEGDQRESAMLAHTRALRRLIVIVVICTVVSTAFAVYAAIK
jgi:ABC-type lipoprotein release transport system permease subunit